VIRFVRELITEASYNNIEARAREHVSNTYVLCLCCTRGSLRSSLVELATYLRSDGSVLIFAASKINAITLEYTCFNKILSAAANTFESENK
jgi:hypothetical protein